MSLCGRLGNFSRVHITFFYSRVHTNPRIKMYSHETLKMKRKMGSQNRETVTKDSLLLRRNNVEARIFSFGIDFSLLNSVQ